MSTKAVRRMLMKLTPGDDFINNLQVAFTCEDPKSTKRQSNCKSFCASCRTLMKLTTVVEKAIPFLLLQTISCS